MTPAGSRVFAIGGVSLLWRPRTALACLILLGAGIVLALLLLGTGTASLSFAEVFAALTGASDDPVASRVVQGIRLPRLLTAALVGAALGMAGAVFQSLSRNPLGSPDVIGFTTGAATGAIVLIVLSDAGAGQIAAGAVASGIVTALAVLALSGQQGGGYRLILVGIGVGALLSGLNTVLMVMGDLDRAMSAQIWLAGSLSARGWSHVLTALAGICAFAPVVIVLARPLAAMEMGDDLAAQLGIHTGRTRLILVLAAVGLTSIATACTGPIAFVALAGPQLARRLTRSPAVPVLSGALAGAVLLLGADLIGQRAPFGLSLPIGLTTGLLGGLWLIHVLMTDRRG